VRPDEVEPRLLRALAMVVGRQCDACVGSPMVLRVLRWLDNKFVEIMQLLIKVSAHVDLTPYSCCCVCFHVVV
jgi:hypothetical protein